MASGHDAHDAHGHDDHGHGHDDHGAHGDTSSFWVVPPLVVGLVLAIVLIVVLGTESGAIPFNGPFD